MDTRTCKAAPTGCNHKIQTVENYRLNGPGPPQVNCSENKEIEGSPVDSKRLNRHNKNNKREARPKKKKKKKGGKALMNT